MQRDPGTDDGVLRANRVGDLAEDLDVLQVEIKVQLGAVVWLLLRAFVCLSLRERWDSLLEDFGIPELGVRDLHGHRVYLRMALIVLRARYPQHGGQARFAAISSS